VTKATNSDVVILTLPEADLEAILKHADLPLPLTALLALGEKRYGELRIALDRRDVDELSAAVWAAATGFGETSVGTRLYGISEKLRATAKSGPATDEKAADEGRCLTHTVRITLLGTAPPVWRRVRIPSDWDLFELSCVADSAFGWSGRCDYFLTREVVPDWVEQDRIPPQLSGKASVAAVLPEKGSRLMYAYGFEYWWNHEVLVEDIGWVDEDDADPLCISGARACPPEELTGAPGYALFLSALEDPSHPKHARAVELGPGFDPDALDIGDAQARLSDPDYDPEDLWLDDEPLVTLTDRCSISDLGESELFQVTRALMRLCGRPAGFDLSDADEIAEEVWAEVERLTERAPDGSQDLDEAGAADPTSPRRDRDVRERVGAVDCATNALLEAGLVRGDDTAYYLTPQATELLFDEAAGRLFRTLVGAVVAGDEADDISSPLYELPRVIALAPDGWWSPLELIWRLLQPPPDEADPNDVLQVSRALARRIVSANMVGLGLLQAAATEAVDDEGRRWTRYRKTRLFDLVVEEFVWPEETRNGEQGARDIEPGQPESA